MFVPEIEYGYLRGNERWQTITESFSERLGPRVAGNAQLAAFNRDVSM